MAFEGLKWLLLVQSLLWIVTLSYVIAKVLEAVFERNRVDAQTLQAALCIYLLLGYVWVYLYGLIDIANPDSFRFAGGVGRGWSDENARLVLFSKLFVYSFAKLTSSGYLDVTPNTSFTNICGSLEAMMGQVFLAVVIARLVGLQILEAGSSEAAEIDKTVESIEFDRAESQS